ncbi:hypothetical protein [Frankia sp. EI5c]|uniref:hypothetical protein n=1 Tax=Frankia sp. EI5c TaxID=683316 RepID=UPI000FF8B1C0|nr:hypothetical protein [Frankia sp. EI5c]
MGAGSNRDGLVGAGPVGGAAAAAAAGGTVPGRRIPASGSPKTGLRAGPPVPPLWGASLAAAAVAAGRAPVSKRDGGVGIRSWGWFPVERASVGVAARPSPERAGAAAGIGRGGTSSSVVANSPVMAMIVAQGQSRSQLRHRSNSLA